MLLALAAVATLFAAALALAATSVLILPTLFTCYRVKWTGSVGGWQAEGYVDPTDGTVVLTATCSDPERVECSG